MKHRKRILAIIPLTAILSICAALPSPALGKEPASPAAKAKTATQRPLPTKEVSPENISVGGKSLSQWRAIFGETSKPPAHLPIYSKPLSSTMPPPTAHRIERLIPQRILIDAQKVYWTRLAVIANNMANVDTVAYKRNHTLFQGTSQCIPFNRNDYSTGGQLAAAGILESGEPELTIQTDLRQGQLRKTGRMLDIAIKGKGFLQFKTPHNKVPFYTRAGNLSINSKGELTLGCGAKNCKIDPNVTIPQDATSISFNADGTVVVKRPGTNKGSKVGQIQLVFFINPEALQRKGGKIFGESETSGPTIRANPGEKGLGIIRQGHLEQSNVDLSKELADWKTTVERINILDKKMPR